MGFKDCERIVFALALLSACPLAPAQEKSEQADSLVRLMQGTSLQLIENGPYKYRKAIDATFLHNGTYLICDTALWNVDVRIINAWGNVKLIQDETVLTSDRLDYRIDDNLAEFRGSVVQLQNKENNTLRAANLDYNTRDSIAVFRGGGAMKDEDGQVIESRDGIYDSKHKTFDFDHNVNMYTDSVFVKTEHMVYDSGRNTAFFTDYIDFWNEGNMLSAGGGWYDRGSETFFFNRGVHGLTERQESWSDTLYVFRSTKEVEMLGNAQIQDTSRHVSVLAEYIRYCDTLSSVTMENQAAVVMSTVEKGRTDTIYAGADRIVYRGVRRCDIPDAAVVDAETRLGNLTFDAVAEFRKKAAEAAAQAKAEAEKKAMEEDPNVRPGMKNQEASSQPEGGSNPDEAGNPPAGGSSAETAGLPEESSRQPDAAASDSLSTATDTIPPPPDTSRLGFVTAVGHVRIFRKDIQVRCDSLDYTDLDSIARFYVNPVVWNDGNRQYTSDSLFILISGGGMDRASLMGNAFIITQEDSIRFDQIKSAEVLAYFDSTSALKRFDALGGANAMFYLKENESLATVNKVECKMLSAIMSGGQLDRVYYYESPKNDAYPVAQMTEKDHKMKGFDWKVSQKPRGPSDITTLQLRPAERDYYESRPRAVFIETNRFFPGYMQSVYAGIEAARLRRNTPAPVAADTVSAAVDSLAPVIDSVAVGSEPLSTPVDTLLNRDDTLSVTPSGMVSSADSVLMTPPTKKELREEARKLAIARRDARWAKKDAEEAARAAAKEQKKLERKRARTRKLLILQAEQDARDNAKRELYRRYYEKKKLREEARAAAAALRKKTKSHNTDEQEPEPSGKRTPQALSGGDVQTFDGSGGEAR